MEGEIEKWEQLFRLKALPKNTLTLSITISKWEKWMCLALMSVFSYGAAHRRTVLEALQQHIFAFNCEAAAGVKVCINISKEDWSDKA